MSTVGHSVRANLTVNASIRSVSRGVAQNTRFLLCASLHLAYRLPGFQLCFIEVPENRLLRLSRRPTALDVSQDSLGVPFGLPGGPIPVRGHHLYLTLDRCWYSSSVHHPCCTLRSASRREPRRDAVARFLDGTALRLGNELRIDVPGSHGPIVKETAFESFPLQLVMVPIPIAPETEVVLVCGE